MGAIFFVLLLMCMSLLTNPVTIQTTKNTSEMPELSINEQTNNLLDNTQISTFSASESSAVTDLYYGNWEELSSLTTDGSGVTSFDYGLYQSCDRQLHTTQGWTLSGTGSYGGAVNGTTYYEGNASAGIYRPTGAVAGTTSSYKEFSATSNFDIRNCWFSGSIRSENTSKMGALHLWSTYVEVRFYNGTYAGGDLKGAIWYVVSEYDHPDIAGTDVVRIGTDPNKWHYVSNNMTQQLTDTGGADLSDAELDSIDHIWVALRIYKAQDTPSIKTYGFFDTLCISGITDLQLSDYLDSENSVIYYDPQGLHIENTTTVTLTESDQGVPVTDLFLNITSRHYYIEYNLSEALECNGAIASIDYIAFYFRNGSSGDYRTVILVNDTSTSNDINGVDNDTYYYEIGESLTGAIDVTDIFNNAGWLDDTIDRLSFIEVQLATDDADDQLSLNSLLFHEGEQISVSTEQPSDGEHLDYGTHTVKTNVTKIGGADDISSVKYRYQYLNHLDQRVYTSWMSMTLEDGEINSGIWDGELELNDTLFEEDEDYNLQVKAEDTNGFSVKETIEFIVDRTPESGLQLGSLIEPDYITTGNVSDDICFKVKATFHESQRVYVKTLSDSTKTKLGDNISLVTYITSNAGNQSEIELYESNDDWKIKLTFPRGYEPTEDDSCTIYFYEEEPDVLNPQLLYVGSDTVDYSLDISTNRDWNSPIWIGETWFPTTQAGWWSEYKPSELQYAVYSDKDLTTLLTTEVTVVGVDYNDQYKIALDIKGFVPTLELTRIYIHGEKEVTPATSGINFSAILFGAILPVFGFTVFLLNKEMEFKLPQHIVKYLLLSSMLGGVAIAIIFQFISFPTLTIPSLPQLSITPIVNIIAASTMLHMIILSIAPFLLSLAIVLVLRHRIEQNIQLQIASIGGIISLIITLGFVTGLIQLALLDVATRATWNLASYFGVAIAIVLIVYISKTVKPVGGRR